MAQVAAHLSITEVEERFRTAKDPILARHAQVIWLLAQGHTTAQVSAETSFGPRWIAQLLARYNAEGAPALGDLRQRNGRAASVLKPDLLERLRRAPGRSAARCRAVDEPESGAVAGRRARARDGLGATRLGGFAAVGWSIKKPRPRHAKAATPEQEAEFKKSLRRSSPKRPRVA